MYKNRYNIYLRAENEAFNGGFDIYLIDSGKKEFLMHHRKNHPMYTILKDGIRVSELERQCHSGRGKKLHDIALKNRFLLTAKKILTAVDQYTNDMWGFTQYDGHCLIEPYVL